MNRPTRRFQALFFSTVVWLAPAVAGAASSDWDVVLSDDTSSRRNVLAGVDALSDSNAWAVGYHGKNGTDPLIEHWNGKRWRIKTSPAINGSAVELYGVSTASPQAIWAVGRISRSQTHPLIERWDGNVWSVEPIAVDGYLTAVSAVSPTDVWAVGQRTGSRTLAMHFDGKDWSVVPSPSPGTGVYAFNLLAGVSAASDSDVWAVGEYFDTTTGQGSLIEYWNGSTWTIQTHPEAAAFVDVSAGSASNVWAVADSTITEHWNGSSWEKVTAPGVPHQETRFLAVSTVSDSDAWAVGYHETDGGRKDRQLIEHWNGHAWRIKSTPTIGLAMLSGVDADSGSDAWAVGWHGTRRVPGNTLTEHYTG
jgi:hypothetical protein